jgi:translation initiation factor 2B subunit (eIF-2B alpha/beta/delta family)
VKVSDDVWADFREATRNSSIAIALAELVTRKVDRYRARRVREGFADELELLEALERAQELHADLAELVRRLARRLELRAARVGPRSARSDQEHPGARTRAPEPSRRR